MKLLIDGRSAFAQRTTGWERYTRFLLQAGQTIPETRVYKTDAMSIGGRMMSDQIILPARSRRADVTLFPTYPPGYMQRPGGTIFVVHDLTWWKYPQMASPAGRFYYRPLANLWAHRATRLVTVSEAMAIEMRDYFQRDVDVISNVVSPVQSDVAVERVGKPYFLAVGSVEPRKNLTALWEAFRRSSLHNDFDLVLVGRQAWGTVPAGIRFTGPVSDEVLTKLYRGAQAFFAASFYEGFGLPVGEATALGTPVYCSDIPAFREATSGLAQQYFDPTSIAAIEQAFMNAASKSGRPLPHNPFTVERMRSQLEVVLKSAS